MFQMNTQATREVGPESEAQDAAMDPQNKGDHQTPICCDHPPPPSTGISNPRIHSGVQVQSQTLSGLTSHRNVPLHGVLGGNPSPGIYWVLFYF